MRHALEKTTGDLAARRTLRPRSEPPALRQSSEFHEYSNGDRRAALRPLFVCIRYEVRVRGVVLDIGVDQRCRRRRSTYSLRRNISEQCVVGKGAGHRGECASGAPNVIPTSLALSRRCPV